MIFTGFSEHTIDEKNRIAIPAKYRSKLLVDRDGNGFVIAMGRGDASLYLYTENGFNRIAEQDQSTFRPPRARSTWELGFFSTAEQVEPDAQGRIVIPPRMLARTNIGRDVVICGVRDHLEIHSRPAYERQISEYRAAESEGPDPSLQ